jgi:F0F1-type ATP synthase membrane subunit b/b'
MSIWAKLSNNPAFPQPKSPAVGSPTSSGSAPSGSKNDASQYYYYSSSSGQMLSSDGSGYVIPNMYDIVAEKSEFIPKTLAEEKLKVILKDSATLKATYEGNLTKLTDYYSKILDDSKLYYENIIKDLKGKALRHVEIQKTMKLQMEEKLTSELKSSEETLDELRDNMADLNRRYQDESRTLKGKISELSTSLATLTKKKDEKELSYETQLTMMNMLLTVEQQVSSENYKDTISAMRSEMDLLINTFNSSLEEQSKEVCFISFSFVSHTDCDFLSSAFLPFFLSSAFLSFSFYLA